MPLSPQLARPCATGAEVLALKKLISRATLDMDGLREQLAHDRERADFLYSHRWAGPQLVSRWGHRGHPIPAFFRATESQ